MIVVADAGPLHYLALIGHAAVLEPLFGRVVIPVSVARELATSQAPDELRTLIRLPPDWLVLADDPAECHHATRLLGAGEKAAISLAHDYVDALLLCDDQAARHAARSIDIPVIGTLGILIEAGIAGCLDFEAAIEMLTTHTNFRFAESLIAQVREEYARRRQC